MTPVADPAYLTAVLTLYVELPDTPRRASAYDRTVARSLLAQRVPLDLVECALLLGSLRRRVRPEGTLPLHPVRSLAYFAPILAELQQQPIPAQYRDYLRDKLAKVLPAESSKKSVLT
jgi:hypothetical protein